MSFDRKATFGVFELDLASVETMVDSQQKPYIHVIQN